jgi:hypothetical protein
METMNSALDRLETFERLRASLRGTGEWLKEWAKIEE